MRRSVLLALLIVLALLAAGCGSDKDKPGKIIVRAADSMEVVQIKAGEFLMGDDNSAFAPEKPALLVTLDEYWIDRFEVSNAQFRLCTEAGACAEPKAWLDRNFDDDEQPALVTYDQAIEYCAWVEGGRLPTEAEWEKAMRGTDGRLWPWGHEFKDGWSNLSSDEDGYGFTSPVGAFEKDLSPYGLYDGAGNAAEWVSDYYSRDYYDKSPSKNPTGPKSGDRRVHRAPIANAGGGPEKSRTVARYAGDENWPFGFRCVSPNKPEE